MFSISDPPHGLYLAASAERPSSSGNSHPEGTHDREHTTQRAIAVRRIVIRNTNVREAQ